MVGNPRDAANQPHGKRCHCTFEVWPRLRDPYNLVEPMQKDLTLAELPHFIFQNGAVGEQTKVPGG